MISDNSFYSDRGGEINVSDLTQLICYDSFFCLGLSGFPSSLKGQFGLFDVGLFRKIQISSQFRETAGASAKKLSDALLRT